MKTKLDVGDTPHWTVELIKQLPHGTVIKCLINNQTFTYKGQQVDYDYDLDLIIKDLFGIHNPAYFTLESGLKNAKIISLPNSVKEIDTLFLSNGNFRLAEL